MSSEGTGSPISRQETLDLLNKLSTESRKVQAMFTAADGSISACLDGVIRYAPDGGLWVMHSPDVPRAPFLSFDPALFVVRKYGDKRALRNEGETPSGARFSSALSFIFGNGSTLAIFEFADDEES